MISVTNKDTVHWETLKSARTSSEASWDSDVLARIEDKWGDFPGKSLHVHNHGVLRRIRIISSQILFLNIYIWVPLPTPPRIGILCLTFSLFIDKRLEKYIYMFLLFYLGGIMSDY